MYYILDLEKSYKERVDMMVDGVIFDDHGDFVTNVFNSGEPLTDTKFKIRPHQKSSQNGKLRDKVVVQINRSIPLFVVSPKTIDLFRELNAHHLQFFEVEICGNG